MMRSIFGFLFILLISLANSLDFYEGLLNSRSQVATYLTTPVTKIIVVTEVKNTGDKAADSYIIAIPKNLVDNLSSIEAIESKTQEPLRATRVEKLQFRKNYKTATPTTDAIYYSIPLPRTLNPGSGDSVEIKITIAYVHLLSPLPAEIKKSGKQYVTYENNRYFYSPYPTKKMAIKFTLASDKIKSYSKPATVKDKKISYGPYNDLSPLSVLNAKFHYQFHVPFLTITEATRDMEISHWGNVRIEETFELRHDGAKLKGPYEPGVIDRKFSSGDPSVVTELRATLPKTAHGVYYIDRIGNVSTSHFRKGAKASYLEMRPRYPLYGGWKTDFTIGYDVPSRDLIEYNPFTSEHVLNVSFGIPFREPVTNLLITTIALPEGAFDISVDCPYDIELNEIGSDRRFTYLDTRIFGGRPLIEFRRRNVASLHNKYFQVRYRFDKNRIYFKPILIISSIFVFLVTIMVFRRINPNLDDKREQSGLGSFFIAYFDAFMQYLRGLRGVNAKNSNDSTDSSSSSDVKRKHKHKHKHKHSKTHSKHSKTSDEEQSLRKESLLEHAPEIEHSGKQRHGEHSSSSGKRHSKDHSHSSRSNRDSLTIYDSNDVKKLLNDIDASSSQANYIVKQLKEARQHVRNGSDESLKQKVNEAYNKAKKHKEDKKRLVSIVDHLRQSI